MKSSLAAVTLFLTLFLGCSGPRSPVETGFGEPPDPDPVPVEEWEGVLPGLHAAFGSVDMRYPYHRPPDEASGDPWRSAAWRGERVNFQLLLWSGEPVEGIEVSGTSLVGEQGGEIGEAHIGIHPVRYVLTDEFNAGCGFRSGDTIPVHLAPDMLDKNRVFNLEGRSVRPVWVTMDVPGDAKPGTYRGKITIRDASGSLTDLDLQLEVQNLTLPPPSGWSYHLDLWQNPFAVARYYEVEPWSEAHLELLVPYLEMLANAGQKCITTSIVHMPWGGQTYDPFQSMIGWKHLGGNQWEFDYTIFDRWVELAMDAGISGQINCYSMVPWSHQVRYYDVDSAGFVTREAHPGTPAYAELWKPFLLDFREHLEQKGWAGRTHIAVDEMELPEMRSMIALIRETAPEFKVALAGSFLEELDEEIHDLCVFIRSRTEDGQIRQRAERGVPITFYTSCARPEHPNNFTFSPPAEQAWLGWHAASRGYNGYLRWAYMSWVEDPVHDSRFRKWPAGDTYQVYPGPSSSIRFERLREGIQDFEKIRIIRETLSGGPGEDALEALEQVLGQFTLAEIGERGAAYRVNRGRSVLDSLSATIGFPD